MPEAAAPEQLPIEGTTAEAPVVPEGGEGEERRERRSRDRFGRDRRERGPRDESAAAAPESVEDTMALAEERRPRYPTGFVSDNMPDSAHEAAPQPAQREPAGERVRDHVREQAPLPAPAVSRGLPKVQPYELPVQQLAEVAEGTGLQWVNSDIDKVAAVRAAIAAEPKPAHVPRERPPLAVLDEGPLVLVETKRDLRAMQLPFEQQPLPLP